jgi:hypothetical protein
MPSNTRSKAPKAPKAPKPKERSYREEMLAKLEAEKEKIYERHSRAAGDDR